MTLINNKTLAGVNSQKPASNPSSLLSENELGSIRLWLNKMGKYKFDHIDWIAKKAKEVLGLKYKALGHGVFRIVFDLGNGYVLKVAIRERGLSCNKKEFNIYRSSPRHLRKHLCPVKEFGHGWIIMKKMTHKVSMTERSHRRQITELARGFLAYGIEARDLKKDNLASSSKGEIVIVDYGHFNIKTNDIWL